MQSGYVKPAEPPWPNRLILESILGACAFPAAVTICAAMSGWDIVYGMIAGIIFLLITVARSMMHALRSDPRKALLRVLALAGTAAYLVYRIRRHGPGFEPLLLSLGIFLLIFVASAAVALRWPNERPMLPLTIGLAALGGLVVSVIWVDVNE